ncbi:TetR/AcrR family transcriptional regulator [Tsukamurella sp. 1534]|uniref:TetR/AcrR family transcriptional regulator n=1 Tax=Tsukamurella sp. 1534 TaxID=1151061 RepID=UPI000319B82C|nr:TetR/AcrR family transcriptional regulator [Tsukamurella sp. 1534]
MVYRQTERVATRLAQRRAEIVDAACHLVAEGGFGNAKVGAIAQAAGVSVGSVYSHFDGIDGVHAEVFAVFAGRELQRTAADLSDPANPRAAIASQVRGFGTRALRAPVLAWALLLEPAGTVIEELRRSYRDGHAALAAERIAAGVAAGAFPPQDARVTGAAIVGAIAETLVRPLSPGTAAEPPENTIDEAIAFCLRAVGAAPETPAPGDDPHARHP